VSAVTVIGRAVIFAVVAADAGIIASLASGTVKPSVFVTTCSFAIYVAARLIGPVVRSAGHFGKQL